MAFRTLALACPNCGAEGEKPFHLTVEFATGPETRQTSSVLRCPECTALFYETRIPPDYAEEAMLERGRVPFYLQQGAGLSVITRPLARIRVPAGGTYAEIGCGFGFGLDYARHAKGWNAHGIDPAGLSALGQRMLGVSIDRRYLGDDEPALAGRHDVVMASETLEHVVSPAGFIRVLRALLRPGGILVLSTPDAADMRAETPPGILVPLLSPGLHLIFQTRDSLRALLEQAGFAHVALDKDGHSLVAFASSHPLDLEADVTVLRAEYLGYLERRAQEFGREDDLFLAFAGRALLEAVNDGAYEQARRLRPLLDGACRARFGAPLEALGARAVAERGLPLEQLARRMPLSLGGLLYADAILRLASGEDRATLGVCFSRAEAAAHALQDALGGLAMEDGMTEDIAWTARAEALLCAATAGDARVTTGLAALPAAPDPLNGAARRRAILERALVSLVNASHYQIASELVQLTGFDDAPWAAPQGDAPDGDAAQYDAPLTDSRRDALFCLAVLDALHDDPARLERARGRFHRVRCLPGVAEAPGAAEGLFAAASRGETAALARLRAAGAAVS